MIDNKEKKEIKHTDILGQELSPGMYVAMVHRNYLHIGKVTKLNPKMIRVLPIGRTSDYLVYSNQTVRLDGPDALAYILKKS